MKYIFVNIIIHSFWGVKVEGGLLMMVNNNNECIFNVLNPSDTYMCETQSTFHETLQQHTNLFNNALLLHSSLYISLTLPHMHTHLTHTHTHTHRVTQVHRVDPMALACFSASAIGERARK